MLDHIHRHFINEYRTSAQGMFCSLRGGLGFLDEADRTNYGDHHRITSLVQDTTHRLIEMRSHDDCFASRRDEYIAATEIYATDCERQAHYWTTASAILMLVSGYLTLILHVDHLGLMKVFACSSCLFFAAFAHMKSAILRKRCHSNQAFVRVLALIANDSSRDSNDNPPRRTRQVHHCRSRRPNGYSPVDGQQRQRAATVHARIR